MNSDDEERTRRRLGVFCFYAAAPRPCLMRDEFFHFRFQRTSPDVHTSATIPPITHLMYLFKNRLWKSLRIVSLMNRFCDFGSPLV